VNVPIEQAGSGQVQVRLRHRSRAGRPKHGESMSSTVPAAMASGNDATGGTAHHRRRGLDRGQQSLASTGPDPFDPTATTCMPGSPTSASQFAQ
jgi:hypothetical protein